MSPKTEVDWYSLRSANKIHKFTQIFKNIVLCWQGVTLLLPLDDELRFENRFMIIDFSVERFSYIS